MKTVLLKLFGRWHSPQICLDESRLVKSNAALRREVLRLNRELGELSKRHAELSRYYSSVLKENFALKLEVTQHDHGHERFNGSL